MAKTAVVRARIDEQDKKQFKHLCEVIGISQSDAITLMIKKAVNEQTIPEVRILNKETKKVFEDTDAGKNLKEFDSIEDLIKDLHK